MRVVCDRKVWRAFVRRALQRYPKEYIEAAWGKVYPDGVHICAFTDVEHIATVNTVVYEPEEIKEDPVRGYEYLGTIHTHVNLQDDAAPSEADWRDALEQDELTIGILSIWKGPRRRRTKGVFWPSTKPLDIELQN